jgi:hypothetical protein
MNIFHLTTKKVVNPIHPVVDLSLVGRVIPDERTLIDVMSNRTESQTRIGANQRLAELPLRMFLVDREEESLQAHGKERRQSDVEHRVEENDLACVGKKLNQSHWQKNHQKELSRESKPFTQSFIESSLSSLQPRRWRVLRI